MQGQTTNIVPCGKCPVCLKKRANQWSFRLTWELKRSTNHKFITLTYADPYLVSNINGYPTLRKKHLQDFIKRLRERFRHMGHQQKLKYYGVGEYGTHTNRPHYHIILFNLPDDLTTTREVLASWTFGQVHFGDVTPASIGYTTGYLSKPKFQRFGELDDRDKEFSIMSKRLGDNYLKQHNIKYHKENLNTSVRTQQGWILDLPRYYKDKIFTKQERIEISELSELKRDEIFNKKFKNSNHVKHSQTVGKFNRYEQQEKRKRTKI